MSKSLDKYLSLKANKRHALYWSDMIDKPYAGGGGGTGEIFSVNFSNKEPVTLYYQERDGSNNYHTIPDCLVNYVGIAIKNNFKDLLKQAMYMLDKDIKNAAIEAQKEYSEIMKDAEINDDNAMNISKESSI